ncbi:hypothetical protein PC116_g29051 [Phytophthora cactorum]|nr:hypothetical protein PC116_g29051 [Phytophthora cactorum]
MKTAKYLTLGILSCLQALSLADNPVRKEFSNIACPWYYLRQNYHDTKDVNNVYSVELIATCSNTFSSTPLYTTSLLDLDKCLVNRKGVIKLATPDNAPLGGFSHTCRSFGLVNIGPSVQTPDASKPIIVCQCGQEDASLPAMYASFEFDRGIWIDSNGVIGCLDHTADVLPYSNSSTPKMIPPNLAVATIPTTVTSTSTVVQNNTVTVSAMVSNNITVVSTAIGTATATTVATATATAITTATATLVSTVEASCPSQAPVTVTKKKKAKTVTVTTTSVSTTLVKYLVGTSAAA